MSAIEDLVNQDPIEYDEDLFFDALNEALERWRKNDLYKRKLENSDFEGPVQSWSDVRDLPPVDMREFKTHPEDLGIEEPDPEMAYYSSGTTSDKKSFAPRTDEGIRREREKTKAFLDELIGPVDHSKVLALSEEQLDQLPTDLGRRGIFRKIPWSKPEKSKYFLRFENGDLEPEFDQIKQEIREEEGSTIIQGATTQVHDFAKMVEDDESVTLGEEGKILISGGWKGDKHMSKEQLREELSRAFNMPEKNVLDIYGTTELTFALGNKICEDDPGLKRVPSQAYVYVADEQKFHEEGRIERVKNGEKGFLVAIDPTNPDYPGVILADDIVKKFNSPYGKDTRIKYVGRPE